MWRSPVGLGAKRTRTVMRVGILVCRRRGGEGFLLARLLTTYVSYPAPAARSGTVAPAEGPAASRLSRRVLSRASRPRIRTWRARAGPERPEAARFPGPPSRCSHRDGAPP